MKENNSTWIDKIAAERLAYECAYQIKIGHLSSRSSIADALLNYLRVGNPGGEKSIPEWLEKYEKLNN